MTELVIFFLGVLGGLVLSKLISAAFPKEIQIGKLEVVSVDPQDVQVHCSLAVNKVALSKIKDAKIMLDRKALLNANTKTR